MFEYFFGLFMYEQPARHCRFQNKAIVTINIFNETNHRRKRSCVKHFIHALCNLDHQSSVPIFCTPRTVYTPQDGRENLLTVTHWKWYSDDSVYLNNGQPQYIQRLLSDTCGEILFFQTGHYLTQRDSCGTQPASTPTGTWFWPQGDSLTLTYAGAMSNARSFRFTGDTLQFYRDSKTPADCINGQPVVAVRTYLRLM